MINYNSISTIGENTQNQLSFQWMVSNVFNPTIVKIVNIIQNKMDLELKENCDEGVLDTIRRISSVVC